MAVSGCVQSLVGYVLAMMCFGLDHGVVVEFLGEMMTPPPPEPDSHSLTKSQRTDASDPLAESTRREDRSDHQAENEGSNGQAGNESSPEEHDPREGDALLEDSANDIDKKLARRKQMALDPRYWLLIFLFSFLGAGLNEEVIKYCAITLYPYRLGGNEFKDLSAQNVILTAVAAGMGFATMENIVLMVATARAAAKNIAGGGAGRVGVSSLTVLERVLSSIPGHTALSALIGVNIVAMRTSDGTVEGGITGMWRAIWQAVLFHGAFDFALLAISVWEGNVGWIHPKKQVAVWAAIATVVGLQGSLYFVLCRKLSQTGVWC
jgi:hypothetical protein